MTSRRRKQVEALNFQALDTANQDLKNWLDIGLFEWAGDKVRPPKSISAPDLLFIKRMIQKRHILIHNGGVVDQGYLRSSGDTQVTLGERISVTSKEVKRFIECIRVMGTIFMDNVEFGFKEPSVCP
jgi:hypothetical protein